MATDRFVITYNGEVFNHVELREELQTKGVHFETHCDTEVVLRVFEAYGPNGFQKLNGQFAFLIWDRRDKTLTAVRDRYGVRPLYVLEWQGRWYFASEMKSFDVLPGFERRYHPEHLLEHAVLWNTLGGATVYQGIRSVEPGTFEVFRPGEPPHKSRFYEIGDTARDVPPPATLEDAQQQFTALLQDAVDLRLRSDVPVGAYLSGGIDSTVIAYLTKKHKKDDFETFSVAFDDPSLDESTYQSEVSQAINSRHTAIQIGLDDIERTTLEAVYHAERPIFRTAPIPLFLLSQRVRQSNIRVVLTGEGADEILYGYDAFKELVMLQRWKSERGSDQASELIRQLYPHLNHYADPKRFGMMRVYYEGFLDEFDNELCALNIRLSNNQIVERYLNKDLHVQFDKHQQLERLRATLPDDYARWRLLQRQSYLEIRTLLEGYLLSSQGDRMALGHGIEGRFPFLDHRLVDAVFHYPDRYKLDGFSQKHLLRETFRGKVPPSVVDRAKRPYMAPDLAAFIRDGRPTEQVAYFLSEQNIRDVGIFDPKYVQRFLHKFTRNRPEEVGYRDNMLVTFLLSAQMSAYWARHPRVQSLNDGQCRVQLNEYG